MARGLLFTLLSALLVVTSAARADIHEGEPLPQTRPGYIRGFAGGAFYRRLSPYYDSAFMFSWGAEAGYSIVRIEHVDEFSSLTLGVHFDTMGYPDPLGTDQMTSILGQLLFVRNDEWSAYFGPEAGIRSLSPANGSTGRGIVAGFVGGVEIPLTTHLTFGPHLELDYNGPIDLNITGLTFVPTDDGVIFKVYMATSWHL